MTSELQALNIWAFRGYPKLGDDVLPEFSVVAIGPKQPDCWGLPKQAGFAVRSQMTTVACHLAALAACR